MSPGHAAATMEPMATKQEDGTKHDSTSRRREDHDYPVGGQIAVCLWAIAILLAAIELVWWWANCIAGS
jgi:hypothetical protein